MDRSRIRVGLVAATGVGLLSGCHHTNVSASTASDSWNQFYAAWVKPVVNAGTPVLVVFAVFLLVSRVLTRFVVPSEAPGPRGAKLRHRFWIGATYWLGVVVLLWASVEAAVVFPVRRGHNGGQWTVATSLLLIAVAVGVATALFAVVGRPRWRQVYRPTDTRDRTLIPYALSAPTASGTIVLVAVAGVLITLMYRGWVVVVRVLNGQLSPLAYALALGVLGAVIVARSRGIGLGLVIQGHDKSGGDDSGLGAFIRARLFALGSAGPGGIEVTQRTDVSTLPTEALSLIPEGVLAKVAQFLTTLFARATPWRVDITEQVDGSIVVSIERNGSVTDAVVIRPSVIELPEARLADDSTTGGDGSAAEPDWSVELRTAAASYILLALSRRYDHLAAGLSGAKDWRSVALQVIAADPATRLAAPQRREILARAVGFDGGNVAAELALVYEMGKSFDDSRYISKLTDMLGHIPNAESAAPLRLRVRFNLMVAHANAAVARRPAKRGAPIVSADARGDVAKSREDLKTALEQARRLTAFWNDAGNRKEFHGLWRDMTDAVGFVADSIVVEWNLHFSDRLQSGLLPVRDTPPGEHLTLLARYERACLRVVQATAATSGRQQDLLDSALDDLELATSVPQFKIGARTDPSLRDLHDVALLDLLHGGGGPDQQDGFDAATVVRRFKNLVGEAAPRRFIDLPPLAVYRKILDDASIRSANQVLDNVEYLIGDLRIGQVPARQIRLLAELCRWLRGRQPPSGAADEERGAVGLTLMLSSLDVNTKDELSMRLRRTGPQSVHDDLITASRPWDVVGPMMSELEAWLADLAG